GGSEENQVEIHGRSLGFAPFSGVKRHRPAADRYARLMRLTAATGRSSRDASERSLTLLHVFLGASAVILGVGAVVLSTVLTNALRSQALVDRRESLTQYVDGVLGPALV